MSRRLPALLLAAALLIFFVLPPGLAEETETWVQPTLSPDAIPYDKNHPELLDDTMLYARSAILIEASTGEVLFEKNADEIMYPASTTKILTGYIALKMGVLDDDDIVTISENAVSLVPATYATIPLSIGEEVLLSDLVPAMLIKSGNDAANAIAEHLSGSIDAFAALMNQTAQMLGCSQDTHFTNPSGIHNENHYTTARDMAIIARAAMQNETFRDIVSHISYEMPATNKHPQRNVIGNTPIMNPESDYYDPDIRGIKTGFTNASGRCYVGYAQHGNIGLISVVFYSSNSGVWRDTSRLMDYGFTQVQSISPEALYAESPRVIDVTGFSLDDGHHGELTLGIRAMDESRNMTVVGNQQKLDILRENFNQISSIQWTRPFTAPVTVGDQFGILTFYSESGETAQYELVATRSIAMRENAPPTLAEIEAYTLADENPLPRFSSDMLVLPTIGLIVAFLLLSALRRRKKSSIQTPNLEPLKKTLMR